MDQILAVSSTQGRKNVKPLSLLTQQTGLKTHAGICVCTSRQKHISKLSLTPRLINSIELVLSWCKKRHLHSDSPMVLASQYKQITRVAMVDVCHQ